MEALSAINRTALGVALIRAEESGRLDRLFDDPFAALLSAGHVSPPAKDEAAFDQQQRLRAHVVLRTRWYDRWLLDSGLSQVVLLGAGLDSRPWRLPWPAGVTIYELDQPAVLSYKAQRLRSKPNCDRRPVATDLREAWPQHLLEAGFMPTQPTAWLAEGLLLYLAIDAARALLQKATNASAAGSTFGCEPSWHVERLPGTVSALWRGGVPGGAAAGLAKLGWTSTEVDASDQAIRWGRPDLAIVDSKFVSAIRQPYDNVPSDVETACVDVVTVERDPERLGVASGVGTHRREAGGVRRGLGHEVRHPCLELGHRPPLVQERISVARTWPTIPLRPLRICEGRVCWQVILGLRPRARISVKASDARPAPPAHRSSMTYSSRAGFLVVMS